MLAFAPSVEAKRIAFASGTSFAHASGNAKSPRLLFFVVDDSSPFGQQVDTSWGVSCTAKGFKFQSRQGTWAGTTVLTRRLPIPLKRPQKCSVSISASQADFFVDPFTVYVSIYARRQK